MPQRGETAEDFRASANATTHSRTAASLMLRAEKPGVAGLF